LVTQDRQSLIKALLKRIDEGRGTPDVRLPGERELASSLGASRTAVREVLGVLEAMRVIERRPKSGIYVLPFGAGCSIEALVLQEDLNLRANPPSYEQAQEARVIYEVEAARLAAQRRTPSDLDAMRAIIVDTRRHLGEGRNLADDDESFHLALIASAGNDILLRVAKSLYLMTRSVRHAYFQARTHAALSVKEHEQLVDSVQRRDAQRSADLMRQHYAGSSARWRKVSSL
jgi:GntR family transcriptional regulator, transcriptional repressor for pyruvate dehydrogenase complex